MTNRIGCCASPRKPGSKTTTGSRVTNGRGGVTEVPPLQSDQSKSLTAWDTYEVPPRQRNETMTIPPKCAHFLSPVCTNKRRTLWTHPLCSSIFFSTLSIYATCIINNLYLDIIPVTQPCFFFPVCLCSQTRISPYLSYLLHLTAAVRLACT